MKAAHEDCFLKSSNLCGIEREIKIASQHAIDLRYVSDLLWSKRLKSATIKEGMHWLHLDVMKSKNYMIEPKRFLG